MKPILVFGAASLSIFLAVCAMTVFGLGQYEHAWGRWGSFQVEAWVSFLAALIAMGAFGISSALMRRAQGSVSAFAMGLGCGVLFVASCWLFNSIEFLGTVYAALALLIAFSCIAAYAGQPVGS